MNKMISWAWIIVSLAVLVGVFCLLKQIGCPVGDCCMVIATLIMAIIAYQSNQQNKVGIEASQKQAEAASEQTKAIQQQIEISKQQAETANQQADIARKELKEAQKQRKEMYRPKLVVYTEKPLNPYESLYGYQIEIENIGNTPAYNIAIQIENTSTDGEKLFHEKINLPCLKHGDKRILTGKDLLRNVENLQHYMSRFESLGRSLQMTLNYNDWQQDPFSEPIKIENPSYWENVLEKPSDISRP